ncbi:hypothetical protein GQ457_12G003340 [Hibiscus cannabinus]
MKTRTDALRTIERLDGFTLYGYRLTVKLARFQPVQHGRIFWRKNETSILNRDAQDHVLRKEDGVSNNQSRMELKRIPGYVEEEELWKMKRRLVGVMATVCSVRNITSRLSEWGLGEIKVQRLGGLSDSSTEISSKKGVVNNESCKVNKVSASVASTSSELMKEELEGDRSISAMEIETLNEMRPKEVCNYDQARESETLSQDKEKEKEISFLVKNTSWAEVGQKGLEVEDVHLNWKQGPKDLTFPEEGRELHTLRTDEDERDMGFKPLQEIADSGSREYMDLWAKAVDEKFNEGLSNAISDNAVSLFVENLPKALHWKGLWHAFARHGDMLYAFIARKLSREGRRFGFVRMKTRTDALRTIERLDGFTLYGYRLTVKLARFQPVQHGRIFWRKNETSILNRDAQDHVLRKEDGVSNNQSRMELKRIPGYVEEEELWKMKRRLVGVMATVCSVRNITSRLSEWGLGEIKVQRLGGLSDSSTEISSKKGVVNNESCKVNKVSASVASTSSELMKEELEGDRSISAMEIETLNEMRPKEVCNYDQARESETLSQDKEKEKEISFLVKNTSWAEVGQKGLEVEDVHLNWKQGPKDLTFPEEGRELHTLRTDEDERDMGFKPLQEIADSGSREYMDLWAKAVDEKFNEGLSNAISDNVIETHSEGDICSAFFSEMEPFKLIKKGKKGKRYSSLLELQNKKNYRSGEKEKEQGYAKTKLE